MEFQIISIFNEALLLLRDLRECIRFLFSNLFRLTFLVFYLFSCMLGLTISDDYLAVHWYNLTLWLTNLLLFRVGFVFSLFFIICLWVLWLLAIRFNYKFVLSSVLLCQKLLWRSVEIYGSKILIKRIGIHDLGDKHSIFCPQLVLEYKLFLDLSFSNTIFLCWLCLALNTLLTNIFRSFSAVIFLCALRLSFLIVESL